MSLLASMHLLQDRLSNVMGCEPHLRPNVVTGMLLRSPRESTAYWLQLLVSVGIATLGLVLGSTAVVIGAMLIAPLMTPIVALGMGLAVGSPFLVLRSSSRIVISIAVAVAASAVMTRLLPFNELNAELAARTTPTALDLLVAAFCAVAGVYAAMRPSSDVASAAAGTSIGISLVPPLCTSGYGIGSSSWSVAGGAALLFLTNLVAIVVISTLFFAAVGFHQVDVRELEKRELNGGDAPWARKIAARLERLFASRSGPWLRLLMPLALLAIVYLPLRAALDEVAWQVKNRAIVQRAVAQLGLNVVHSRLHVERGKIDLALVVVGSASDVQRARSRLDAELEQETGTKPTLEIAAVADARALAGLEAELKNPVPIVPALPAAPDYHKSLQRVRDAVLAAWPRETAGKPLAVSLTPRGEDTVARVTHLGASLPAPARELLERQLLSELGMVVKLADAALPARLEAPAEGWNAADATRLAVFVHEAKHAGLWICLELPEGANPEGADEPLARRQLLELVGDYDRRGLRAANRVVLEFAAEACGPDGSDASKRGSQRAD